MLVPASASQDMAIQKKSRLLLLQFKKVMQSKNGQKMYIDVSPKKMYR